MPLRSLWSRAISTTPRKATTVPIQFHTFNPLLPSLSPSTPKLGRIGKWYLPTMALITLGMVYLPKDLFSTYTPSQRTVTLYAANRHIGFAIANALEEHNTGSRKAPPPLTQSQRNQTLMDAYGARSTLEDMERAFESVEQEDALDPKERNTRLVEAYGDKASLRDLEKAMQIYEVQ